jgi:ABC-type nitrate/sulfonate/bicarbonate transport system ATPase subunit
MFNTEKITKTIQKKIAIETNHLSPVIDGKPLYNGINIKLYEGKTLAIMGKSGIGKTLLLECLAHNWQHVGKNYLATDFFRVFQDDMQIFPWMTVEKNLKLACQNNIFFEIIRSWKLQDCLNKLPVQISVGQRQRITLARALARKENILLCDEPLSSVDSLSRIEIAMDFKKMLKKLKKTIVWITHDVLEAKSISDKILVINKKNHAWHEPNEKSKIILQSIR